MTFEKSENKNFDAKTTEKTVRRDAETFLKPRIHELLQRAETEGEQDKKRFVAEQIVLYGKTFFQGKEYLLDEVVKNIEAANYTTDAEFEKDVIKQLTNVFVEFIISSGFSLEETRQHFNNSITREQSDFIPLDKNNVLYYSRFNDEIEIHITRGFTMQIWKDGMFELAQIVLNDEGIKTITMTSWVVVKHPNIIRKSGFIVDEKIDEKEEAEIRADLPVELRDKPLAKAHISREKFLEMFMT